MKKNVSLRGVLDHDNNDNKNNNDNNHSSLVLDNTFPVSDLEEDLRAASAFLSTKRTSSVFTDSLDDLSSR